MMGKMERSRRSPRMTMEMGPPAETSDDGAIEIVRASKCIREVAS